MADRRYSEISYFPKFHRKKHLIQIDNFAKWLRRYYESQAIYQLVHVPAH